MATAPMMFPTRRIHLRGDPLPQDFSAPAVRYVFLARALLRLGEQGRYGLGLLLREGVQAIEERGCTVLRCGHVREMHEVGSGVVIGNGGSLGGVLGVAAVASSVAMPSVYGWSMYGWLGGKHSIYIYIYK